MEDKTVKFEISDLLPPFWSFLKIDTEDRIVFLGANTIFQLINFRLEEIKKFNRNITDERARQKLFKPKGAKYKRAQNAIKKLSEKKACAMREIEYLKIVREKAGRLEGSDRKPCLALARPMDHFVIGEKIMLYINGQWIITEVLEGREPENYYPFVAIGFNRLSTKVEDRIYPVRHPGIVKIDEFEYLKRYPVFAVLWAKVIILFEKTVNPDDMAEAIKKTD